MEVIPQVCATNLIVLGDSNAKGIIHQNSRLILSPTNAINRIACSLDYTVTNLSFFGQTIAKAYKKGFIDKILAKKQQNVRNLVVINLGSNDADYDWSIVGANPKDQHYPRTSVQEFEEYYTKIIKSLQNNGCEVMICSLLPLVAEKYFDNVLTTYVDTQSMLEILEGDKNNLTMHQKIFDDIIYRIAKENNLRLLDLRQIMLNNPSWRDLYCEDGIHLNEKGQEFIANEVLKVYKK